jgi:hypothetical protein
VNLGQIVQHVHQLPLAVNLLLASQTEALDTDGIVDVAEDRFDDPQAHTVDVPTNGRVDLLFHPFQRAGFYGGYTTEFDVDLPGAFLVDATQAFCTLPTPFTLFFVPLKLHENRTGDFCLGALEPQLFAGWTDTGLLVDIDVEVFDREAALATQLLCGRGSVFSGGLETRIARTKGVVGNVSIDVSFFEVRQCLLVTETAIG